MPNSPGRAPISFATTLLAIAVLATAGAASARAAESASGVAAAGARAVAVDGKVFVARAGVPEASLEVGNVVEAGATVRSEARSSARLLLPDRTVLDVSPETTLRIDRWEDRGGGDRDAEIGVEFGRVRASVNRKLDKKGSFKVKTKASVFSVRGTDFRVDAETASFLTVFEGKVEAAPPKGKPTLVPSGHRATVDVAGLVREAAVNPRELQSLLAQVRNRDPNFTQSIVVENPAVSRRRGRETLAMLPAATKVPPVSVPKPVIETPGRVVPNASVVSGATVNYYPVQTKVTFTP